MHPEKYIFTIFNTSSALCIYYLAALKRGIFNYYILHISRLNFNALFTYFIKFLITEYNFWSVEKHVGKIFRIHFGKFIISI